MSRRPIQGGIALMLPLVVALAGINPTSGQASQVRAVRWSITLRASATHLRIGQVLTLRVNAPAAAFHGGRRVYLENLSTRQIMRVCSASTGLNARNCIAQDQHEVPLRQQYRAFIVRTGAGGLTVLARSGIVTAVWQAAGAWSVHLRANGKTKVRVTAGTTVTLRAVSSRPLGGEFSLEIRAKGCIPGSTTCIRGGILITTCYSGTVCSATVSAPAEGGNVERYRATILGPLPGGSGTVARSTWVTVHW